MSGGVDSSVAAALLAREGHEVIGLSMQLYDHSGSHADGEVRFGSCCTIDDLHDARRVASQLGIPHYIVNFEREFDETVVSNFVREYANGRTPIPCVHCNGDLKFATLAALAHELADARQRALLQLADAAVQGLEAVERSAGGEIIALDLEGIAVSTGAACSSGTLEPSHVLRAMGLPTHRAQNSIRFSLGAGNTDAEIDYLLEKLPRTVEKLRSLTGAARR